MNLSEMPPLNSPSQGEKIQLIYIHGGEAFDSWWAGHWSSLRENVSRFFKSSASRWPDTLVEQLPEYEVVRLQMPSKYNAKYDRWQQHFERQLLEVEGPVVLLGWSLGANFLAKYLSENQLLQKVQSVHLVAGCYGLAGGFWLKDDFPGQLAQYQVHLYHSEDDFVVPVEDFEKYRAALPQAQTHLFPDRNHFLQPEFLELVEQLRREA